MSEARSAVGPILMLANGRFRSRLRLVNALSCLCICCVGAGCQRAKPIDQVPGCVAPAMASVASSGRTTTVRCDFTRTVVLVAVPEHQRIDRELSASGLPSEAVIALRHLESGKNRWCTVEEVPSATADAKPGLDVQCTTTDIKIEVLSVATGKSIVFELGPSDSARVRLTGIRATGNGI